MTIKTNQISFEVITEWNQGFTGRIEFTNHGDSLNNWILTFAAPYDITGIWGAEIISQKDDLYKIQGIDTNTDATTGKTIIITFNANKVNGQIIAPENYTFGDGNNFENNPAPDRPALPETTAAIDESEIELGFKVITDWNQGFTGRIEFTNHGDSLNNWTLTFAAPYDITGIWGAEIISQKDDLYTIQGIDTNTDATTGKTIIVTFNANKVNGQIIAPANYTFGDVEGDSLQGDLASDKPAVVDDSEDNDQKNLGDGTSEVTKTDDDLEVITVDENSDDIINDTPEVTETNDVSDTSDDFSPTIQTGQFSYGEAVQKSFLFYEAQRSGDLPEDNRIDWRGDSSLNDGADVGRDLTGGYHDAGDHVKFGQPMAQTMSTLAWGGIEYQKAYQQMGQWDELLDAVKWGTDYFLKAHVSENGKTQALYVQVGDGNLDHAYWGAPETMTMERPAFKIDQNNPGTEVAAGTAAALASAAMLFQNEDTAYANRLIDEAKQLYEFADTYRGIYSDSVPAANPFYTSWSGYEDELIWGATWLYKATGETQYLQKAENYAQQFGVLPGDWTLVSDDYSAGSLILLSQLSNDPFYSNSAQQWLDTWIEGKFGVEYTSGGLAWRTRWGSLTLSSSTAFLAGVYHDTVQNDSRYHDFATSQIDYILGDNPRNFSYQIGFGDNYPLNPHHRAASGDATNNEVNQHILYGALVGGPQSPDDFDYNDERSDWITNEVATGYNAAFTGALAYLYDKYGGDPLTETELDLLPGISVVDL